MTQACALACRHCRAESHRDGSPEELSFEKVWHSSTRSATSGSLCAIDSHRRRSAARADLYELIDEARALGVGVSITPAATPALTREVMLRLKQHGVEGLGLSLDGSNAARHDSIRGVPGTYDRTMQALRWAQELELPVQVNTLAASETAGDMPAIYEVLKPFASPAGACFS